jgi:cysteine desulfurase
LNVPGIVGLGKALELSMQKSQEERARLGKLRDQLEAGLENIEGAVVNGNVKNRMSHVSNMRFAYVDGEALMASFQTELAVASGSACTSADPDPSHVLMSMGLTRDQAKSSLRFSLGRTSKTADIERAIELVSRGVERLRSDSPAWKLHKKGLI